MTSTCRNHYSRALVIAIVGSAFVFAASFTVQPEIRAIAQAQASIVEPNETTKARLQTIINGILAAWDKADVVCLGEDHGSRNDSDLRIALVQHPDFIRKVNVIIVEFADTLHQDLLDRFVLEGEDISRDQLRAVWKDTSGKAVWESPIYEAFLRAVRKINLSLPRTKRVRLIGGDNSNERNRGRFIREAVSREILDKSLKGLAIYGSGHCECRGMGFPGELSDKYPGKIWAASSFYDVDEGRRVFGLGDEPKLIPITGTEKERFPVGKMFFLGRYNDPATLGDIFNAIVPSKVRCHAQPFLAYGDSAQRTLTKEQPSMTATDSTARGRVLVAIDIAKAKHEVLVELPTGKRRKMIVRNQLSDFKQLASYLKRLDGVLEIALEPTADYHRNLAYFLKTQGFEVKLVSSIAVARTREALHNSWDKNDPKDAQVILHLLRNGNTQYFYDPLIEQTNDLQELSKTHFQISLRKTRVQHSLLNHYLPLYFPEAERFLSNSRSSWFARLLIEFPTPQAITQLAENEFIERAAHLLSSKHSKAAILRALYAKAQESVGLPVPLESQAIATFRLILVQHLELCRIRAELEATAHELLQSQLDYQILRSVPGIGPIIALTVLAEAGDLRRFRHERQFLKFCGLDLATSQSGAYRGRTQLSKRGNSRLRSALWMAARCATHMNENTFRRKFSRYMQSDPANTDLRRKAYTACTAKMARTIYGLIKHQQFYRAYNEDAIPEPGGRTRSHGPLRQAAAVA